MGINMNSYEILFQPDGLRLTVDGGTILSEAILSAGISVNLPCAGTGRCGKCVVEIQPVAPEPGNFDSRHLSAEDLVRGLRLA